MEDKQYDIVVFGASGFTGQFVTEEIARTVQRQNPVLKWAIAGRSAEKLQSVLNEASKQTGEDLHDVPVLVADVKAQDSLDKMCQRAKLVLNCVGPYALYGEPVVRACIENKTHHIDISGEPMFLEKMQLLYNGKAKEQGIYIIGACGWDSIPADMGVIYTKNQFKGRLCYLENYTAFRNGPHGSTTNSGTWRSAVHSFSFASELKRLRSSMPAITLPKPKHPAPKRPLVHYSKEVNSWCIPFIGCDKSVVYRTQRDNYENNKEPPVSFSAYMCIQSLLYVVGMIPIVVTTGLLSQFNFGRHLLIKYPRFFSCGMFSDSGPTRKQIEDSSFSHTFLGYGHDGEETDEKDAPKKKIVIRVSGPDAGYISTPICMVQAAYVVLSEQEKMPPKGGVLTPGTAFAGTRLQERLEQRNIKFTVLEQ
ncbi:Saccharopine dehydrogenase-like oxidoreductase [Lamellibrachia satsuma]|nr:Saccharopine dehydrogenase-like oxidoreductase [Lamellibrachia satsuma]